MANKPETNIVEVPLTEQQVAARLALKVCTLRKWREKNFGPPYRKLGAGRKSPVRYPEHMLTEWLQSCPTTVPASH